MGKSSIHGEFKYGKIPELNGDFNRNITYFFELRFRWLLGGSSHLVSIGYIPSDFSGISRVNPLITGDATYLLSGMIHQVGKSPGPFSSTP